jgi:hypothetical protein
VLLLLLFLLSQVPMDNGEVEMWVATSAAADIASLRVCIRSTSCQHVRQSSFWFSWVAVPGSWAHPVRLEKAAQHITTCHITSHHITSHHSTAQHKQAAPPQQVPQQQQQYTAPSCAAQLYVQSNRLWAALSAGNALLLSACRECHRLAAARTNATTLL